MHRARSGPDICHSAAAAGWLALLLLQTPNQPVLRLAAADLITLIQQLCTQHSLADAFYSARVSVHV